MTTAAASPASTDTASADANVPACPCGPCTPRSTLATLWITIFTICMSRLPLVEVTGDGAELETGMLRRDGYDLVDVDEVVADLLSDEVAEGAAVAGDVERVGQPVDGRVALVRAVAARVAPGHADPHF